MYLHRKALWVIFMFALPLVSLNQADALNCPTGARPATADDAVVKNGQIKIGTCYDPTDRGVTVSVEEAKEYLTKLGKAGKCGTASPEAFQKLNDAFAVCAQRFFTEYQKRYGAVTITSAYRSPGPGGSNQCAGGVDGSNHTRGVAMDVHPASGNYDSMMNFARSNPQLGVCFPRPPYNGKPDLPHMVIGGLQGGEGSRCTAQGITKACDGVNFDPSSIKAAAPGSSPSAEFTQAVRQALGISTQQPAYASQGASTQQPISQTQSPLSSYQPQQGIAVTTGTGATSGAGASSDSGASAGENVDIVGVSSQIGATSGGGTTHATTAADRLEELAFGAGTNASAGSNATSVPLIVTGSNATELTDVQNSTTTQMYATSQISPTQQTFTSGDLSWQTGNTLQSSGLTGWDAILVTIKATLNRIVQLLQPFGARGSLEGSEELGE